MTGDHVIGPAALLALFIAIRLDLQRDNPDWSGFKARWVAAVLECFMVAIFIVVAKHA